MTFVIILVSVLLAAIRMTGHKSQSYQAAAHLWVGGLCAAWLISRYPFSGQCVVMLSVVEVACFVWFKMHGPVDVEAD